MSHKVVAIAGGGGIATATARRLGASGASVVVGDRRADAAEAAAKATVDAGGKAAAVQFDISDDASVGTFIEFAVETFGRIDALFNVAADVSPNNLAADTDALDIPLDVWQHTLDVNLTGFLLTIRHALPHLIANGGGPILNTISGAAYMGEPQRVAYGVSKAGITALTRHVARRWGKDGIRCNAISPGLVLTESAIAAVGQDALDGFLETVPSPRHGSPDDIAAMAALLLSSDGAFVNGQAIVVDGGLLMR